MCGFSGGLSAEARPLGMAVTQVPGTLSRRTRLEPPAHFQVILPSQSTAVAWQSSLGSWRKERGGRGWRSKDSNGVWLRAGRVRSSADTIRWVILSTSTPEAAGAWRMTMTITTSSTPSLRDSPPTRSAPDLSARLARQIADSIIFVDQLAIRNQPNWTPTPYSFGRRERFGAVVDSYAWELFMSPLFLWAH